jgi:hypothetical protein
MIGYEKLYVYSGVSKSLYRNMYGIKVSSYRMFLITSEEDRDFITLKSAIPDEKPMYVMYANKSMINSVTLNSVKFRGRPVIIPVDFEPLQKTLPRFEGSSNQAYTKLRSGVFIETATVVSKSNDGDVIPDFLISNPLALIKRENFQLYSDLVLSGNDIASYIWKLRNSLKIYSLKSLKKSGGKK